ncbi:MAG: archease [Xanthomonadales bacterium]|nr:archease [Xanthomonadales bacterium]
MLTRNRDYPLNATHRQSFSNPAFTHWHARLAGRKLEVSWKHERETMHEPDPAPARRACRGWAHFPHMADIGVRGFGVDIAQAFEQAALALTAVITDPDAVRPLQRVDLVCEAPDIELLLTDWLNAIVFEMATRRMLFSRFDVRIEGTRLRGQLHGEAVDQARHRPAAEVKGATMTELRVERSGKGCWRAQCIVDV